MVLKRVNWAHDTKIRSYGLERSDMVAEMSDLGTQYKHQVKWS